MKRIKIPASDPIIIDDRPIYDGMVVLENDFMKIEIRDLELDYSGCYYESDSPSITGRLVTIKK